MSKRANKRANKSSTATPDVNTSADASNTSTQEPSVNAPHNAHSASPDGTGADTSTASASAQNAPNADDQGQPEQQAEPDISDIGKNNPRGKRGPSGPRTGSAMGAKPLVRKLLGTPNEDGTYPAFSMEELCSMTKKSEVNIRTILSDLRSAKYCGQGGVFMTKSVKDGNVTKYRFCAPVEEPQPQQSAPAEEQQQQEEATA